MAVSTSAWVLAFVDVGLRRRALKDQIAITIEVALRSDERRLVFFQGTFRLRNLRIDLPRIERQQDIPLVDTRAVLEIDRSDGGVDAGLERNRGEWRNRSDGVDFDRDGFLFGLRQQN